MGVPIKDLINNGKVVLGDHVRSLVLGMPQTFAQLKREVGGAVEV